MNKKYYAFISYSHKDEEWAKWLQHEFEHYHLPTTLNGMTNVPDKFRPIFRDIDELSGGELKPQITHALKSSAYLVIICSPNSAKSSYVDAEIREFIEIGEQAGINNISNIFPFIIEGVPHSKENPEIECFPEALRELASELIAGDVTKHGREHAFVKILSGTLHHSHIGFGMLWNQFERDRIEAERKEREKRDRLLLLESRYLSEKALDIAHVDSQLAKMLLLRALPKDLNNPEDRPYCIEAESALRSIWFYKSAIFQDVNTFKLSPKGDKSVSASSDGMVRIWDIETASQIGNPLKGHTDSVLDAVFSHDGEMIASCSKDGTIILWNSEARKQIATIKGVTTYAKQVAFTHDDKLLIALSSNDNDRTLRIWDVENRILFHEIPVSLSNDMSIDKDDKCIALATASTSIEIYDLKNGRKIKEIPNAHTECLTSIDFSPDGKRIVSATIWGEFIIRDWMTEEILLTKNVQNVHKSDLPSVYCVKYSSNGKFIITASSDNMVRIWNATSGDQFGEPLIGHKNTVLSAYFSQDGSLIVSSSLDGTARTWDLNPEVPYRVVGRARNIPFEQGNSKSALSPDGKLRVELSRTELKVLDVKNNMQIGPNLTFFDSFYHAMFLRDGSGIICDTEQDYDLIFDWQPLQELIEKTREQVKRRQFTEDEKKKYYIE